MDATTTAHESTPAPSDRSEGTGPLFYLLCFITVIAIYVLAPCPIVKALGNPPPQPLLTAYAPTTYLADNFAPLLGAVLLIIGLGYYAKAKGYSAVLGLLGLLSCIGLLILAVLPDKAKDQGYGKV